MTGVAKDITPNISKPKMTLKTLYIPFLFKSVKWLDTIRVVQILCFKPSSFCAKELSLYSCNVVGILIKLIFLGGGVFLNNHNNVVFTWIFYTRNMTIDNKVVDLGLTYVSLCLQYNVLVFMIF